MVKKNEIDQARSEALVNKIFDKLPEAGGWDLPDEFLESSEFQAGLLLFILRTKGPITAKDAETICDQVEQTIVVSANLGYLAATLGMVNINEGLMKESKKARYLYDHPEKEVHK